MDDRHRRQTWLPKGKGRGINWEFGMNRYTLAYINKELSECGVRSGVGEIKKTGEQRVCLG